VKLRGRKDGWNAEVQCAFLAQLYITGSVAAAAKAVGRSRASAYKLRERRDAESFARSWDKVLSGPMDDGSRPSRRRPVVDWRKLTQEDLNWRIEQGFWKPILYRDRMCGIAKEPDNTALLRLVSRLKGGRTMLRIAMPRVVVRTRPQIRVSVSCSGEEIASLEAKEREDKKPASTPSSTDRSPPQSHR
jgi:hypothetical protein